jgi:hypothetical protein
MALLIVNANIALWAMISSNLFHNLYIVMGLAYLTILSFLFHVGNGDAWVD